MFQEIIKADHVFGLGFFCLVKGLAKMPELFSGRSQPADETMSEMLRGFEERLASQLNLNRDAIVGALGGGGEEHAVQTIVLLPEPDSSSGGGQCPTCGRSFDAFRLAIHASSCARLQRGASRAAIAAQDQAEDVRRSARAQLAAVGRRGGGA